MKISLLPLCALIAGLAATSTFAENDNGPGTITLPSGFQPEANGELPFMPGEKLTYALKWGVLTVGTAEMQVLTDEIPNDRFSDRNPPLPFENPLRFHLSARTAGFVDHIYQVRNDIESWVDPGLNFSLYHRKDQLEGDREGQISVYFDWQSQQVQYFNYGEGRDPVEISPSTFDPLSIMYAFRNVPIDGESSVTIHVTDGQKYMPVDVKILGRESVTTMLGTFDCIKVEPNIEGLGGVFRKSPNASIHLWITNDDRRIPVLLASSVSVGEFSAELIQIDRPEGRVDFRDQRRRRGASRF